jgi:Lamin Tail Domain/CotH kinase protein
MYHTPGVQPEYVEITNLTSNRIDAARWKLSGGVSYTFPDFNAGNTAAHFIKEYERIILSSADEATTRAAWPALPPTVRVFGPWTGLLSNGGDTLVLADAAGAVQSTLNYGDGGDWPASADGAGHSLQIINQNGNVDDFRNWRASRYFGGSPGVTEPALLEEPVPSADKTDRSVVDFTSQWKYWRNSADPDGVDPEGTWFSTAFTEPGWSGPSPGFFGRDPSNPALEAARGTSFSTGWVNGTVTYYFRTTFNWAGPATGQTFNLDQWVDDGVIYYLNGVELKGPNLGRIRMPGGASTHTTTATATPAGGDAILETNVLNGSLDGQLLAGTNLLCAEVHQNSTAGDDIYFGARLRVAVPATGGVVINEVRPYLATGGFVEFYNPTAAPVDLNGYYLSDTESNPLKYRISLPTVVPAGGLATVGFSESNLSTASPVTVLLTQPDGFTRQAGFSSGMVPDGRSTGRKPDGGSVWALFTQPTPGQANATQPAPTLTLSEVNFAPSLRTDWVEFYNTGTGPQLLDGCYISSRVDRADRVALTGTLAAGGYASVAVDFATSASGDLMLYLTDGRNNVLATAEVRRRAGLPSVQAFPVGSKEWYNTPVATRDAPNNPERQTAIVINEIMAKPPSDHESGEYVELFNQSAAAVDLSGWRFTDGISWAFPAGTTMTAGQYLVLAKNPAFLNSNYPALTNVQGPYGGTLRNSGEKLRLEDSRGNTADLVDYKMGGQWPTGAGGEGSSLELMHPAMDNNQPSSWRASDESNKSTFQTFTHTGTYKGLRGDSTNSPANAPTADSGYRELLVNLVGDGYVILRNIKLSKATAPATNLILTGDATSHTGNGANGFLCTGTHADSDTQPRAATPVRDNAMLTTETGFHLISQGTGDTKANKAEVDVIGIRPNDVLTLSFEGRWVSGLPLMVAQTWDRSFGKVFRFPVPGNLGTPGAVNSRVIAAAAPTVDSMTHFPVVPTPTQPVIVTARVSSVSPLTAVSVFQRQESLALIAATGPYVALPMNDSGTGGDALAGDGIWSGSVPARANTAITQFYIKATAANGQENECPRRGASRPGMWIVSNVAPSTVPGTLIQRSIISQFHRNALVATTGFSTTYDWDHPRMSNYGFNSTFIFNETEVLYNCELRRGGSPWTRVSGDTLDRTRWKPPGDQLFRERTKSGVDNDAANIATGNSRFHNRITRYLLHLFGYPVPDSEFIQQIINSDAARLGDEQEQTDSDFFDRAYADGAEGELFEIDDAWFMFDTNNMDDRIGANGVTGRWELRDWNGTAAVPSDESPIFFHGNWPVRFPEERYDFASLSSFIKVAVNNNANVTDAQNAVYREQMERMLDVDRAAIYAAVRGYAGDWDNFTSDRGKNGYFYRRPTDGRFEFHHWDSDLAFQSDRTALSVVGVAGGIGWTNLANRPWFIQKVQHYLTTLMDRYTNATSPRMNAWLTAMNYQSANINTLAPFKTAPYNYITSWFNLRNSNVITSYISATNLNRVFAITTAQNQSVTNPLFTIVGTASSKISYVEVVGHPEAVFTWTPTAPSTPNVPTTANTSLWRVTNIALAQGLNSLTVRSILPDGTVANTLVLTVTLTGNGPPLAALTSDPASGNVAVGETLHLDATTSRDPEGLALNYAWSILPSTGVSLSQPLFGVADVRFTVPGTYTVTVQVTDAVSQVANLTREFTVFNSADFSSFGNADPLGPEYSLTNLEVRDNFSPSAWYSVEDVTGRILVQLLEDTAKPLAAPAFTYPLITRDLPDSADFVLQTALEPETREFGNWRAGLQVQLNEGGTIVRYAFGLDAGLNLILQRAALPANFTTPALSTTPVTGSGATLRVRRLGNSLLFQYRTAAGWITAFNQAIPVGTVADHGGLFVATSTATSVRIGFDYLLLSDPTVVNSVLNNLRITEIQYRPAAGGVEFIELRNTGTEAIDLTGVSFGLGQPFSMAGSPVTPYTFGAQVLAPGEYITLTDNIALFQSLYGMGARLAPPWTSGSLSNSGERIMLLDAQGNTIQDFSYGTGFPWPSAANGTGPSMEVIATTGDYAQGTNWRASSLAGGNPGTSPPAIDTDGDGVTDSVEALFGTNPGSPGSVPRATLQANPGGSMTLTWPSISGVTYRVESCTPLAGWQLVQAFLGSGSFTFTPTPGEPRRFYRVSAVVQ